MICHLTTVILLLLKKKLKMEKLRLVVVFFRVFLVFFFFFCVYVFVVLFSFVCYYYYRLFIEYFFLINNHCVARVLLGTKLHLDDGFMNFHGSSSSFGQASFYSPQSIFQNVTYMGSHNSFFFFEKRMICLLQS